MWCEVLLLKAIAVWCISFTTLTWEWNYRVVRAKLWYCDAPRPNIILAFVLQSNLEGVLDWKLTMDDMQQLSNLCVNQRMVDGSYWVNPQGPYRTLKVKKAMFA